MWNFSSSVLTTSAVLSTSSRLSTVAVIWLSCTSSASKLPARIETTRSPMRQRSVSKRNVDVAIVVLAREAAADVAARHAVLGLADHDVGLIVDLHPFAQRIFAGEQRAGGFLGQHADVFGMLAVVIGNEPAAGQLQIGQIQIGRACSRPGGRRACGRDSRPPCGSRASGVATVTVGILHDPRQVVAQQAVLQDAEEPAAGAALRDSLGGLTAWMMMLLAPSSLICCWAW